MSDGQKVIFRVYLEELKIISRPPTDSTCHLNLFLSDPRNQRQNSITYRKFSWKKRWLTCFSGFRMLLLLSLRDGCRFFKIRLWISFSQRLSKFSMQFHSLGSGFRCRGFLLSSDNVIWCNFLAFSSSPINRRFCRNFTELSSNPLTSWTPLISFKSAANPLFLVASLANGSTFIASPLFSSFSNTFDISFCKDKKTSTRQLATSRTKKKRLNVI